MAFLSRILLTLVLGCMIVGILSYQIPIFRAQAAFSKARNDGDIMQEHFKTLIHGIKELKLHGERRRSFLKKCLAFAADSFRKNNNAVLSTYSAASSWGQSLVFILIGLLLLLVPVHKSQETLTGYSLLLLYLLTPLQVIMNMLPNVTRANVALMNIAELHFDLGLARARANRCGQSDFSESFPFYLWRKLSTPIARIAVFGGCGRTSSMQSVDSNDSNHLISPSSSGLT